MRPEIIYTEAELKDICESYLNGESSVKIGKRYGTSHKPILKVLEKMGIERDQKRFVRKYYLNEHYFDEIDTPNKAYVFGLLYADGSINIPKSTTAISLQEDDRYLLEQLRNEIGSEKPLEYLDYSHKHDFGYNYKNQYRLILFSKHICKELSSKGLVQNKSLVLEFPTCIKDELLSHFIRGYFDGNGSINYYRNKRGNIRNYSVSITSTEMFLNTLNNTLDMLGLKRGNIFDASCHNGITKQWSMNGFYHVTEFCRWMYTDADLYMVRKKEKYEKVIEARIKSQSS